MDVGHGPKATQITQFKQLLKFSIPMHCQCIDNSGLVGVEELDRPTGSHGTPPKLLVCEFQAVGYTLVNRADLPGHLGYFAVFRPPAPQHLPAPEAIVPCRE